MSLNNDFIVVLIESYILLMMLLYCSLFYLTILTMGSMAQTWLAGDNSTVYGCSSHCGQEDTDLNCWNSSLIFFERTLIAHLRHYIAVQVDIDQWHRRHGMPYGQNFSVVSQQIKASFVDEMENNDILSEDTVRQVADTLSDRIRAVSNRTITWVPHFECPIPCEYRHDTYRNLFIASMVLNSCLILAVVPFILKLVRKEEEWTKETLIPKGRLSSR